SEKAKKDLSELASTSVDIPRAIPLPDGTMEDLYVELTREQFEDLPISSGKLRFTFTGVDREELQQWCEELRINPTFTDAGLEFGPDTVRNRIRKSRLLVRKAMKEAGVTRETVDHVLLVGGSTTVPLVQR